jgi:hypothetical protein
MLNDYTKHHTTNAVSVISVALISAYASFRCSGVNARCSSAANCMILHSLYCVLVHGNNTAAANTPDALTVKDSSSGSSSGDNQLQRLLLQRDSSVDWSTPPAAPPLSSDALSLFGVADPRAEQHDDEVHAGT